MKWLVDEMLTMQCCF